LSAGLSAAALLAANTCAEGAVAEHDGNRLPDVQCAPLRSPPCVHADWPTPARCRAWPRDEQWPTADAALRRPAPPEAPWATMAQLSRRFFANKTVMFVGDSVTIQLLAGLTCEAERTGLRLERGHDAAQLSGAARAAHEALMRRIDAQPDAVWLGGRPQFDSWAPETNTTFVQKGWGHFSVNDTAANTAVADVLVVNYGLHYNPGGKRDLATHYAADMARLFAMLDAWAAAGEGRVALFRETGAQAFPRTGAFEAAQEAARTGAEHISMNWSYPCEPMSAHVTRRNLVMERNAVVVRLGAAAARVRVVPWYADTARRWAQHVGRRCQFRKQAAGQLRPDHCADCTHFCWTPLLYARAAHDLAGACQAALGLSATTSA
jgi:hypothetical protein